ncbi:hypothetical protein PG993_008858 [Apiospora rasikravindrae]|uniref:2EXR domain-containing protein n=1 Tax=Apiospora rasikravindrae TaxID=990691 RepID=A0ABR1SRA3_9PEZI
MAKFTPFPHLAPELQIMIWEMVLDDEADNRVVFVHRDSLRIMPVAGKCLVSPLLSVSHKVRQEALRRYSCRLDMIKVPTSPMRSQSIKGWASERGLSDTLPEEELNAMYWDSREAAKTYNDIEKMLQTNLDSVGTIKGCVYLNRQADKFLLSYDGPYDGPRDLDCCVTALAYHKKSKVLHPDYMEEGQIPQQYMSAKMSRPARRLMKNLVFISGWSRSNRTTRRYHVSSTEASTNWMTGRLGQGSNNPTETKFLSLNKHEHPDGVMDAIVKEGPKSLTFCEWEKVEDASDLNGWKLSGRPADV